MAVQKITLEVSHRKLAAYWLEQGQDCLIFSHGFRSSKESQKATLLAGMGEALNLSFFALDFGGCGESEGELGKTTLTERIQELGEGISFLRAQGIERFILVGSSFGALVSLYHAHAEDVLCSCFIACPLFFDPPQGAPQVDGIPVPPHFFEDLAQYAPVAQAAVISHGLVIHGEEDAVVPPRHSKDLFDALLKPKKLLKIPNADHRLSKPEHRKAAVQAIASWVKKWR